MPDIEINGVRLHYRDEGNSDPGVETIVFAHALLMDNSIFDAQIDHLKSRYRCIAYDHRGQGASQRAEVGYDMDNLAEDAAGLIEALRVGPCHFMGLSMGGFVGLRLAITRPHLLKSLILFDTSADRDGAIKYFRFRMMNFIARRFGLEAVAGKVMPITFGQTFLADPAHAEELVKWRDLMLRNDKVAITRAVKGVIDRASVADRLGDIDCPTLIIVGEEDRATPPEHSERLKHGIKGAELVRLPRTGHISTVEEPQVVNQAIDDFLDKL